MSETDVVEVMEVEITSVSPEVFQSLEDFFRVAEFLPELLGAIYFMAFVIVGGLVAFAVLKGCRG